MPAFAALLVFLGLAAPNSAHAQGFNLDSCQPPSDSGALSPDPDVMEFTGCGPGQWYLDLERRRNGSLGPTVPYYEIRVPNTEDCGGPTDQAGSLPPDIPVSPEGEFHYAGSPGFSDEYLTFDGRFDLSGRTASGTLRIEYPAFIGEPCTPPPYGVNFTFSCTSSCQQDGRSAPDPNHAPIARPDTKNVDLKPWNDLRPPKAKTATVFVLKNDSDPDGDPIHITSVGASTGTVFALEDKVLFKPNSGTFVGTAYVDYAISDGRGGTDGARVRIDYRVCSTNQSG